MVKIYAIYSEFSSEPLAVIRTDGGVVDFATDNTNGEITHGVLERDIPKQQQFAALQAKIEDSSHLKLVEKIPDKPFYMLRYTLDNGDVVEVTADGASCFLNGEMLTNFEKNALFDALRTGALKVSSKTDPQNAIPFAPPSPKPEQPETKHSPETIEAFHKGMRAATEEGLLARNSDSHREKELENLLKPYYNEIDPSEMGFMKSLLGSIKHRK